MTDETDVDARARLRREEEETQMALGTEEDALRAVLRDVRGELAGIRTRLDSLVAIEKQLGYQAQRIAAIEKRLATLVETRVTPVPVPSTTFQSPPG